MLHSLDKQVLAMWQLALDNHNAGRLLYCYRLLLQCAGDVGDVERQRAAAHCMQPLRPCRIQRS